MNISSIVAVYGCTTGSLEVHGDGVKMTITLTPEQCARLAELGREFYLDHQAMLAEKVAEIPPSNRLEAPKAEGDYADFTPVDLPDDMPF